MRALIFAASVSLGLVPALSVAADRQPLPAPPAAVADAPRLPLKMRAIGPLPRPPGADLPLRLNPYDAEADDPLKASTLNIGPFSARLGGTAKRAHIARYRLEGMDVLGGSVSGTLDGRGARIYLRWPPSDDE